MKKLLIAVILVLTTGTPSHSQPRLVVPAPVFDFGYTPQNVKLVHHFWFKSAGTDTLRIDEIKTGCSCALMPLEKDWIAPGDSMKVSIYWQIKRNHGGIDRYPRVFTNAGPDPVKLHLKGIATSDPEAVRPITSRPFRFLLARLDRKDLDSLNFTLTNHSNQDLAVGLASAPPEECEIVLPDSVGALSSNSGYVRVRPEFADSAFQTSVTLHFSNERRTRLTIPVTRKFYTVKDN